MDDGFLKLVRDVSTRINKNTANTINRFQIIILLLPAVEAILVTFLIDPNITTSDFITRISNNRLTIWIIIVIIFHIYVAWIVLSYTSEYGKLFYLIDIQKHQDEYNNALNKIKTNEALYRISSAQQLVTQAALVACLSLLYEKITDIKEVDRILSILFKERSSALGFHGDEYYNIALYIYNPETNLLEEKWRKADDRMILHHRNWEPGEGHTGLAFREKKRVYYAKDLTKESTSDIGKSYETDKQYYRSILSIPIPHDASTPSGILNITSSKPDHFSENDRNFGITIANILSIFVSKCNK
jgi:hypothetical protein